MLAATGSAFQNAQSPIPMLQIGTRGQTGLAHLVDLMISTVGPVPGAKLIEWNLHDPANSPGTIIILFLLFNFKFLQIFYFIV